MARDGFLFIRSQISLVVARALVVHVEWDTPEMLGGVGWGGGPGPLGAFSRASIISMLLSTHV